ncbi:MAG: LemA family protein [Pseudomonadota bacterium]
MKSKASIVLLSVLGVIAFFVIVAALYSVTMYNRFVSVNEGVNNAWAQVQNQYQRRADLVPNLVETVKGYAKHERETLENVVASRAKVGQMVVTPETLKDPKALANFDKVQGELSSALSRLMAVAENYPNLKANENFLQLQAQLEGTENRISVERMRFNEIVQRYNVSIRRFPAAVLAGMFGFGPKAYFEAQAGAEKPPQVKF